MFNKGASETQLSEIQIPERQISELPTSEGQISETPGSGIQFSKIPRSETHFYETALPDTTSYLRTKRLRVALVLGALAGLGPFSIDMYLPALPSLAGDFGTTASLAQLSLTFFLLGLSLGQILAGPFSDIRGRRLPILGGVLLYTLSSLLCALSPNIWTLIILRFIQGLAGSAGVVVGRAVIRDLYSGPELTRFIAGLMLVSGAAPVIAPLAGGQLLRVTSWHGVFYVLTLVGAVLFLAIFWAIPETLPPVKRMQGGFKETLSALGSLVKDKTFMGYALSQGLVTAALFAYISGSPFVLQKIFQVSPQMFSLIFAINSCGIIIAGQAAGRLASRLGESRLYVIGLLMSFTGGVTLLISVLSGGGLVAILLPLFLVVSSVGVVSTAGFTLAMANQGQAAGSASGLLGVLAFVFGALAAPLVGIGGSYTAVPLGIVIATAGAGAMLCYYLMVVRAAAK